MKSLKELRSQINEVLKSSDPIEKWIDDFVHSKNPKFASKTKAERIDMAKGAYYGAQKNESAAVSQNSTAEVSMNEDHLVHVNDGSKYDEEPHEKDVEHIMAGVKKHGGEHAGSSDKGVFFKFKSPEHASNFISHVNKCPHKSCDAHMSEGVEYKGIGTDVVDKKKKLNPQPNFTTDKKQVKDFKEEAQVEEGKVYDPITKKMVATKPIKVQAGGGATKNGVPVETGPSKYKQSLKKEEVQIDELDKKTLGNYVKKSHDQLMKHTGSVNMKFGRGDKDAVSYSLDKTALRKTANRTKGMDQAINRLTKEETVTEDVDKAALRKQYKDNESNNNHTENAALLAKHFGSKRDQNQVAKAKAYRDKHNGYGGDILGRHHANLAHEIHKKLYDKLHEEAEQIDELSKDTLASYAKKASKDARIKQHVAADFKSKEAHARNPRKKETWGSIAKKYQSQAWKREDGHNKAIDKLTKEEVIDEKSDQANQNKTMKNNMDASTGAKWKVQNKMTGDAVRDWDGKHKTSQAQNKAIGRALRSEESIEEAHKINDKVEIISGSAKGTKGHIGEIRHGAFKGAPKTYTVYHGEHGAVQVKKEHIKALKEETIEEAAHVYDTKTGKVHSTHDTYKKAVNAMNKLNKEHPGYDTPGGLEQGKFGAKLVKESRGHKVLATFFKNREVAQRAFNKTPDNEAETAKKELDLKLSKWKNQQRADAAQSESVNPALMAIMKARQSAQNKTPKYLEKGIETPEKDAVEKKRMLGMKEAFLSKSEEDDIKNLDAYTFYKKYGRNKAKHRASHVTRSADVEKYTEETVVEGHDDYAAIAKELVKKHGKNVTKAHITDFEGSRDSNKGLDHAEVMHHVKKLSEGDKVYDDTWKHFKKN